MVIFTVWFICLLVVRSYACKFCRQSVGWGRFGLVCLLVGGYVLTLEMVSVLGFFLSQN